MFVSLLAISIMFLHYFYTKKRKYGFWGLLSFTILGVLTSFGLIVTISGEGITPEHALLLSGYSKDFFQKFTIEKLKCKDYVFYLNSFDSDDYPNNVITVQRTGLFYQTIDNQGIKYTNDEYLGGQTINIITYQFNDKYIHFISFFPKYFEEVGHIGYLLPDKVIINGEESKVEYAYYCITEEKISSIRVNGYDFQIKE